MPWHTGQYGQENAGRHHPEPPVAHRNRDCFWRYADVIGAALTASNCQIYSG
ncbi:hypothetical protein [Rhizobium giardinii]|uniref:hypothetical protein n=1 Tax=Rhizobium giardinii TaxID=56731 RepID=UPI0013AF37A5